MPRANRKQSDTCNNLRSFISGFRAAMSFVLLFMLGSSGYAQKPLLQNIDSLLKKVELIPMMVTGNKDNRINIVIMNRWTSREKEPYNKASMKDTFLKDIRESLLEALTPGNSKAQTVFANYRSFFNVYALWWPGIPEWGNGVDISIADSLRNRFFLPWKDENTGWVTILAMPNVRNGGGGAGRNLEERIGDAVIAGNGIGKMLHEISHTCMSLGDEYTGGEKGLNFFPTYNSTIEYRRDKIKWRKWIDPNTPLPTPYIKEYANATGAFEGNQYHLVDYFRSSAQGCIMGAGVFDNTEKMCPVCQQRVAMRVYSLVNPINSYFPSSNEVVINGTTVCRFSIDHIKPEPNTQTVKWLLNGKIVAAGVDSISLSLGSLDEYELVCRIKDETPFIRPDPPFGQYPQREIKWHIQNLTPAAVQKKLNVSLQLIKAGSNFELHPLVEGGMPPYSYQWSTGDSSAAVKNILPGQYNLQVTDRQFRHAKASYVFFENQVKTSVNNISTESGSAGLQVQATIHASVKNADNGSVLLDVKGGNGSYTYEWTDKKIKYTNEVIYEAENASAAIAGHTIKNYFGASNQSYLAFNGNEGLVTWKVVAAKAGIYPVDIFYAAIHPDSSSVNLSVNGSPLIPVTILTTRPLYTGWEKATVSVQLQKGNNWLTLSSAGQSAPNIDYIEVPSGYTETLYTSKQRMNLSPGKYTVLVKDNKNHTAIQSYTITEADHQAEMVTANKNGMQDAAEKSNEVNPATLKNDILLWLDASDTDGDGMPDQAMNRGPVFWKDKINPANKQLLVKYQPDVLNGKGVSGFDNVWVQSLNKEVNGFQTILMVYKESDMSFAGKSPFIALSKYMGKSRDTNKALFDPETTDTKTKEGKVFLNGTRVDPFTTPNPMKYCLLTVELGSKAAEPIKTTDGYWEGSVAELLVINRVLTEEERKGIEAYLRKKWL